MPVLFSSRKRVVSEKTGTDLVTPDATSGPAEWGRYHDAVREASRSFDNPQEGDIRHFLNARAKHPEKVDLSSFHEAVKRQRTADLVDIADHHIRREGSLPRGNRMVRVQAPKGYVRRALRKSTPEDLAHLRHRLTSIGHHSDHVDKYLSDRVSPDIWDQATALEIKMSDEEFDGLTLNADGFTYNADDFEVEWENPLDDVLEAIAKIKPEVHVHIDKKDIE